MNSPPPDRSLVVIQRGWLVGGVLVACAAVGAWWALLASPALSAREAQTQSLAAVDALLASAPRVRARLAELEAESRALDDLEAVWRRRLPAEPDEAGFLQWLSEVAGQRAVLVKEYRPAGRETLAGYETRSARISLEGSFEALARFLDALRNCPRMSRLADFEITPRDSRRETFALSARVVLYAAPAPVSPTRD